MSPFFILFSVFYKYTYSLSRRKTWNDFHLFAIDGSKIELPTSKSTFSFFGQLYTTDPTSGRKKYYTEGLASIIYDVLEDYIVHASLEKYLASERDSALIHLETLEALNISKNSIVIFDRGYYSAGMFGYCVDHSIYCVMRLKERLDISRKALESGDLITTIDVGTIKQPREVRVRVIVVKLPDGSNEFLATNLFDETITKDMFRELTSTVGLLCRYRHNRPTRSIMLGKCSISILHNLTYS